MQCYSPSDIIAIKVFAVMFALCLIAMVIEYAVKKHRVPRLRNFRREPWQHGFKARDPLALYRACEGSDWRE